MHVSQTIASMDGVNCVDSFSIIVNVFIVLHLCDMGDDTKEVDSDVEFGFKDGEQDAKALRIMCDLLKLTIMLWKDMIEWVGHEWIYLK